MKSAQALLASLTLLCGCVLRAADSNSFPVTISVHASQVVGPMKPIWRFFGADEPNYATMPNGTKLIGELGQLRPEEVYFRTHNLLTSGDGTPALKWGSTGVYSEDAQGKPVYNWTILDGIFDTYHNHHVRPYVEIGFMPEALSTKPEPYQHHWSPTDRYSQIFTGWAYPPNDYDKWSELVSQWVQHAVARYGKEEVQHWYWETWNEANIGYWKGTPQGFYRLHDYAVAAVRHALPNARVGGPDSAGAGDFLRRFLDHCARGTNFATGQIGTPVDFISFHAKGSPVYTNGHVRMGISSQLRAMDSGFSIVASFPEFKHTPIVIGESDPEGCAACQGEQLGYRNGTMYSSYTAASFARAYELADKHGVNLEGALTWAFEFENQPPFAGFRAVATSGIDLPVLNVFRMFSKMPDQQIAAESDSAASLDEMLRIGVREKPDVSALAATGKNQICVLVWHYHDDDVEGPVAEVNLTIDGLPTILHEAHLQHFRIDATQSNAFTLWKKMGSPQAFSQEQFAQLEKAGQLAELDPPKNVPSDHGKLSMRVSLPRQAVSLLVFDYTAAR
jgi:xylan 1,4-beta-xylosidase